MLYRLLKEPFQAQPPPFPKQPTIISGFPQNSLNQQSFELNHRVVCNHLVDFTRGKNLLKGQSLHAHVIKSGLQTIPLICHHLINFYSKLQLPYCSEQIFRETLVKSSTTWSSIISCFTQNELPFRGLEYFKLMLRNNGMFPDDYIFPCATKSCAMINGHSVGQSVHCLAVKIGFDVNVYVGSSVVDMYAKCGSLVDARKMFDEMPEKNVVSWSGMIYGYAQIGEDEDALRLFKAALWEGLNVNDFTFSSVIRVWSALISMYSKSGMIEGAYQVFDEVLDKNLGMWNAMKSALCFNGGLAWPSRETAGGHEINRRNANATNGVRLGALLTAAGRYQEAAKARKMLRDRGQKKKTGLSWVEEGNRIHTFAAGDRTHEMSEEIYRKLERLGEDMERAGYVADTTYVLKEVDFDEKSQTIRYHSERLAIAFALITFPPKGQLEL
ncbi:hypothetical protein DH2020_041612 [Rehmannia glutinosa]|uniref:DYW domain-containing protein n=1 Tax=Rehmannia glutinosa TaxID=99300 RepID=A0ABR0UPM8_REHGL